jgi:hypothetical protein
MQKYQCKYCNKKLASKSSFNNHISNAIYCINNRGPEISSDIRIFKCNGCKKNFSSKQTTDSHTKKCLLLVEYTYELKINQLHEQLQEQKNYYNNQIKTLQDKLENIAIKAVSSHYNEPVIEIEDDSDSESDHKEDEKYKLTPLYLGKNYTIKHRDEDGFINVTDLCKAGGKQFNDWKRLQKTQDYLKVLSKQTGNPVGTLINTEQTSNTNKTTWVHPQVAINIAQWISSKFDVMVSAWVYEVMMSGKVDISNTKTYRQLQSENKDKSIKIQYLTKKYVKSQPRVQYKEKNVIYILTTKNLKKERRYILGKAINLTNRLSTYNKSDEHEVVFYQECPDEETMGMVETMVFQKLKEYREQANRERFILPKEDKIEIFSDIIKKCLEFLK